MADISIIIPSYNRLWSLPKAIESCRQTSLNTEVIVIDDGSTDDTWAWLSSQENVVCIRQDNFGKDWAVNQGFRLASGKYIRFLDSDDWLLPFGTDELFREAELKALDITCAGYQIFDEQENFIKEIKWTVCDDFLAQQLGECDSSHYSAYLFKRDFISDLPHRQEFGALDDRRFIIEAAMRTPKTGYIDVPTLAHRVHAQARLQSASGLEQDFNHRARLNMYKKCFDSLEQSGRLSQRHKDAASNILWHLSHWVARNHLDDGKAIYDWTYQLTPDFKPKENLTIARLYQWIGFVNTERLLKIKRLFK